MRKTDARTRRRSNSATLAGWVACVSLLLALLATSCAPPGGVAPRPAPTPGGPPAVKPGPRAGYDGRRDSLDSVDATAVRGKRIVLDPGHGGIFPGTVGVDSLTEKEVNLAVALVLRDLLVAAGAEVKLTRETDRDYLTPADSSLKADLTERVRIANEFAPDLFVSIHHNADPGGSHDVNETQTYYRLGDEGPSYDAAQDVFRALTRNLGIETTKMIPGNFFVIRNTTAPALLTEASYLTYPPTEAKLRTPEARRIEAEVFYLGIVRWFMRRAPQLTRLDALDAAGHPDTLFTATPRLVGEVQGAYDSAILRIDGAEVPLAQAGDRLTWERTPPLAGGTHEATLTARLATEGTSRARRLRFHVRKPAARVALALVGSPLETTRSMVAAHVTLMDADELPVPDSLRVRLSTVPPGVLVPAETTLVTSAGEGWAYLRRARGVTPVRAARGVLVARLLAPAEAPTVAAARLRLAQAGSGQRTGFALLMPNGARLTTGLPLPGWLNRDGFAALAPDSAGAVRTPQLAGFRRFDADTLWPPGFVAIAGGALHARRIAIDPEGGGDDAAGSAPGGTRGSSLNLDVGRALAAMLTAAGADVVLTRDGDHAVSELERVQVAESFRAERYLRIGHANTAPLAGHYFNSPNGRRWAQQTAATLAELGFAAPRVGESAKYPLSQSSATALYVTAARTDSSEAQLVAPGRLRAEAYALFLALARDLAVPGERWPLDSLRVLDADGRPVAGAPVRLGAALVVATDSSGTARFARTEPGPLDVRVEDVRARLHAVLLDSERGRVLQVPR
jgi:N-acetylmuramoyl-L-alanine amidase